MDEKEEDVTSIRVYGLNESNENICVRINNFTPFVYLELPENIPWTASKAQMICNKLDNLLGDKKPLVKRLMYKKRLYYAHINPNGKRKTFPYLFLSFSHHSDIRNMSYKIRKPINVIGVGIIKLKMHEQDASPILQFTSYRNISTAGWCDFAGKKVHPDEQKTLCHHEYKVKWKNFKPNKKNTVASPLIMGFDIEVNSTNPSAMPKAEKPGDKVFQVSCVLFRHGDDEKNMEKYLLTLGEPDPKTTGEDVEIYMYETEHDLLIGYTEFIQEKNPNVIVGYNILNFDIPYMIDRAKMNYCIDSFDQQGFVKYSHAVEKTIKWSSSAYGNQTFQFLDAEGRLYVDLLPLVKRDYKMDNYKLKTISTHFLGATKDPLSVKGIFKCYRIGIKHNDGVYSKQAKKAMGIVGKYCIMDSVLVIRLFNKLQTWIGLCEMAKTCNVPIFYLYTQGQQIKVYSQLYKYCFTEDTKVSLVHGNVPIKMLEKNKDKVLSWDEKTDRIIRSNQIRFFNNGKHDCISLEFEDGRTITCTRDHLFADVHGKWIKAVDIKLGSRVKIGPVLPDISIDTQETILSRILGYIVTDGHISKHRNKSCAFLGTLLDADIFVNDIEKLCGFKPKIKKDTDKSNCFTVGIPVKVVDMINNIDGIYCGNRTTNPKTCLPINLLSWNKDRLREFLGGLFGGDGWSCSYNKITNSFTQVGFTQSRTVESCIQDYFQILVLCLEKFDIQSKYSIILKNNNYVGSLIIQGVQNLYNFVDKIGYRYCYNKTMRTSVAYMYYKLRDQVKKDKQNLFDKIIFLKNSGLTMIAAYNNAIQNITTAEYMPTVRSYMRYIKNGFVPQTNIVSYNFIKVSEFIELTGSNKCFMNKELYHSHIITKTQTSLPTFSLKLIRRKKELNRTVYDIEVDNTHSFMANGVVVHNCMYHDFIVEKDGYIPKDDEHYVGATVFEPKAGVYDRVLPFDFASLYPTTIIAYNIDYSTLVNDPNIPDRKCHVMEWEDHVGCSHDKTVRKTKPKHVMCCKRHFRFLKEPKGVMPTVLENLLGARAYTRKQIKILKKIISEEKINDTENESVKEFIPNILNRLDNITDTDKKSMRTLCDVLDKRQLAYKVSANSMYGAMGVTRGYLPFMPGAMCLDGNSKISYSYGYTRKLKDIKNTKLIWAYDNNRQVISNGNGLKYNGKREVVKITLIDGRTIRCTPDHKIMTENGWIEASKMVPKYKWTKNSLSLNENCSKVIVGTELPEDIITDCENGWSLLDYTMNTEDDRTKTLAFCRILGFILSDGTISKYTRLNKDIIESSVCIGTLLDANMFVNDIEILTNKRPSICNCKRENIKGSSYVVHIPKILVNKIIMLEDIIIGKRSHQPYTLPKFLLEDDCPLSIIREFLGGLFGGDGTSPSLSISHPSFSPVCFGLATIEKYKDNMNTTMNNLIMLLNKFDLNFWQVENKPSRIREKLKPKDYKENPRWEYLIRSNTSSSLKFAKKIGFRYCSDKTNKLSVASSYQRFSDNTRKQHTNIVIKASEIYSSSKNNIQNSLNKAREEEYKQEIPINEYYSLASCTSVYNHRTRPNKLQNVKLLSKYFPTAREYTKLVKCEHWFSDKKTGNKIYSLNRTDISSPCIILDVIDIRYDGVDDVYDIVDVPQHSFLANGIVVHNCTTAMGRKNIGIVAKTIPEKFGGKLIYGDTDCVLPDCPVLVKNKNGFIEYMTMEEISDGIWKPTPTGKQISQAQYGLSVWSDIGFTKIKHIIRNSVAKPLIRVTTHTGSVECSLDHSLLWENGDAAKGKDVKIGDKLCISEMPLPEDTPKEPLYPNNLTEQKIEDYIIPETLLMYSNNEYINCELAFVWGLFYADGSCGKYPSKATWAINNQDNKLLNKCLNILNKYEKDLNFIIMDTMKSSGVNKLSPRCKNKNGSIVSLVKKYRDMFYDQRRSKRIPNIIFNSPFDIRQSFFMGYYAGDGSKKDPSISCSNKGAIGSAGLFYLMKTIGYKVSINVRQDKPDIYKLTGSSPTQKFRYCPNKVKKIEETAIRNSIIPLEKTPNFIPPPEYIYDIETENHHFAAGVGQLVVHNSNYIVFPHLKTAQENWDHALYVASEVTKMFPAPIVLEFEEEIYWRFFILTKKRYMYKKCGRDGVVEEKVGKKGVLLARRDNSVFIRNIYETLIMKVFNKSSKEEILDFVIDEINKLCSGYYPYTDFIITKAVGDHGNLQVAPFFNEKNQKKGKMGQYTVPLLSTEPKERARQFKLKNCDKAKDYYIRCLPAVVQLAERMRFRGQRVDSGTRLEYVISTQGGHKGKQYEKVEDSEYFKQHQSVLKIDYLYYLKLMANPFDDVLNVLYDNNDNEDKYKFSKDLVLNQYKHRSKTRVKLHDELSSLLGIKLTFKK